MESLGRKTSSTAQSGRKPAAGEIVDLMSSSSSSSHNSDDGLVPGAVAGISADTEIIQKVSGGPGTMTVSGSEIGVAGASKPASRGRKKSKKPAHFKSSSVDPFEYSHHQISLCVHGKPRSQGRDRHGWNLTRYNPSKSMQKEFRMVVEEICQHHLGRVPNFGTALLRATFQYRFPPPVKGMIQNTADIDNLCKFTLDAMNGVLYNDDGQIVSIIADKAFDEAVDSIGYTVVTLEVI
jgi:Holliday junction resolvase RusA-like endonuclease